MIAGHCDLPETEIHHILSNSRRRQALQFLQENHGTTTVRKLSEEIASVETGERPPPRDDRKAVYVSLHQTHLPGLDDKGVIEYDRSSKEVALLDPARDIRLYTEVVTKYGITWAGFYQNLGLIALVTVVASLADVPAISLVPPILWGTLFLLVFIVASAYRLWKNRWVLLRRFQSRSGEASDASVR